MGSSNEHPTTVLVVAVTETAGSALYGMIDVLKAAGNLWQELVREDSGAALFDVRIVSPRRTGFNCGNAIPVRPDCSIADDPQADIIILPEIWLAPDEDIRGRYPGLMTWLRNRYEQGSNIYTACSGSLMLAESGLLNGCEATSHWGYQELFRDRYPDVQFRPESNLVFADPAGRIVTAGGTTSWHDLAIHIIARHGSPGEALRIAKVYLLKWHSEGQLPYASLVRNLPHSDQAVQECEDWLTDNYTDPSAVVHVTRRSGIAERTLKRRFKQATGNTLIDYVQKIRIEAAKRLLEDSTMPVDEIAASVGYEDNSFFRRLFKRLTGLTPSRYRRLFKPIAGA
jgi:transcriptional regulator GlxA family with amidase domain